MKDSTHLSLVATAALLSDPVIREAARDNLAELQAVP